MSDNQVYNKLKTTQESSTTVKPTLSKFTWPWIPYEKKFLIILVILMWGYLFGEYMIFNQSFSNELQGLSDGYLGFKKVHNFINLAL